ncbi:MAG TPA: hypothetical protein VEH50_08550 [Methylomirabilota bacterium]|nr:hypothetical protein [Methylomirabilota bacterium]
MKPSLNTSQRSFSLQRMTFGTDLLSPEIAESLHRASLACAENQRKETGILDFFCGLYLQDRDAITPYFTGDFATIVSQNFPIHRFGREGLIPKVMLDQTASTDEAEPCSSDFSFPLNYSDELHRLIWLSAKLANAVGKKASVRDVVAAAALDKAWTDELQRSGLVLSRSTADFDRDVGTVVFHDSQHMGEGWQRTREFELDGALQSPFQLELSTPSGPFRPVHSAKVKLNGIEVASVSWPNKPTARVEVELLSLNRIEFELDGPSFGSIDVTVRGNRVQPQ